MLLKKMQGLHEDHSVDFLSMLKESVRAEKRLKAKVAQNEEFLIRKKREEKLNRKELQKMISLHPNPSLPTPPMVVNRDQDLFLSGLFGQ